MNDLNFVQNIMFFCVLEGGSNLNSHLQSET